MDKQVLHLLSDPAADLLYLDRYWREEQQVRDDVLALLASPLPAAVPGLERLFPAGWEEQRRAAEVALAQSLTVLTGGPGTGKTTTVARLLALLAEQAALEGRPPLRIALAAPTGKAAARLLEAVRAELDKLDPQDRDRLPELTASTLHRLLRPRPDNASRFRHHRENRLPHDVIVVDETSMVSLTLMARLLEAVRTDSRLILVGDPDQLASVEAGAVLADLVDGLGARPDVRIAALQTSHRFGASIGALASAIRDGDADRAVEVLRDGGEHIEWLAVDEPGERLRPCCCRMRCGCARPRSSVTCGRRPTRSTSTGCCARTAAARRASRTGTVRSSGGSPTRRASRSGRTGTRAAGAGDGQRLRARLYNGDTGVAVVARRGRGRCADRRSRSSRPAGSPTSTPCTR